MMEKLLAQMLYFDLKIWGELILSSGIKVFFYKKQ